jgi:hypothetical protein
VPDTPTTEGSIVAYLRLDDSDWKAKLDEAEARARELGRVDPTIKVHADTAEALAKLEEVKALEAGAGGTVTTTTVSRTESTGSSVASNAAAKVDAVAAAESRLAAAEAKTAAATEARDMAQQRAWATQQRFNIAVMRETELNDKKRVSDSQAAAASLATANARTAASNASAKAALSQQAVVDSAHAEAIAEREVAAAQQTAARAALENAAAQDAAAGATNKQADAAGKAAAANKGNAGYMGVVLAAVAAIIPLAGPLAGTFSAVTGSLMGMGSAGVLAVLGIKNAMTAGNAVGNDYSAGLHVLKGDLDQLSQTSAVAMMDHFNTAITVINQAMPSLNDEIGRFSGMLGTAGNIVLHALVSGFQTLNPLFVQAGIYIEQIAAGFDKWTTNGGLAMFAHDAQTTMPMVTAALGAVMSVVVHLIGTLAPLGGAMLFVLTVAANLANVLLSVLQPPLVIIATLAAAVWGAFALWRNIGPAVTSAYESVALMSMYTLEAVGAVGVLAIAVGAVTIAIVGWNAMMDAQKAFAQEAALATQDYTAAITADSGAIKENTAAAVAKNLHDSGAIENAHKLGISTQTLTEAIFGNKTAIDQVNAATAAQTNGSKAQDEQLKKSGLSLTDLGLAQETVRQAVQNNTLSLKDGVATYKAMQAAQDAATTATQSDLSVTELMTAAQNKAKTATDAFALALTGLGNVNLSATQANIAYMQAVADSTAAVAKNGATLDLNTQQGRDNTSALDNIASSAVAVIAAQAKAGTSAATLTANMQGARDSFIQTAEKMGATADEANHLADQYGLIPANVNTAYTTSGDAAAQKVVTDLQAKLDALPRFVPVTIQVTGTTAGAPVLAGTNGGRAFFSGGGPVYKAGGGPIETSYLAGGGNPFQARGTDTVAAMLTPEEFVVKQKSAAYDPQFLSAYNADPARALASVAPKGTQQVVNHFHIYGAENTDAVAQKVLHYQASQGV